MAYLFEINNKVVFPNPETLLINPFKKIWERDKSENKTVALEEFAYIEFMSSSKKTNPYRQYPEDKKEEKIIKDIITNEDWKPDSFVQQGIEKIIEFQREASTTYNFYMSAKRAAEKMQKFFDEVDVNERDPKTSRPIWTPKNITNAINDTSDTLATLKSLEKKVEEELYEEIRNRSDKKISPFANPENFIDGGN